LSVYVYLGERNAGPECLFDIHTALPYTSNRISKVKAVFPKEEKAKSNDTILFYYYLVRV